MASGAATARVADSTIRFTPGGDTSAEGALLWLALQQNAKSRKSTDLLRLIVMLGWNHLIHEMAPHERHKMLRVMGLSGEVVAEIERLFPRPIQYGAVVSPAVAGAAPAVPVAPTLPASLPVAATARAERVLPAEAPKAPPAALEPPSEPASLPTPPIAPAVAPAGVAVGAGVPPTASTAPLARPVRTSRISAGQLLS